MPNMNGDYVNPNINHLNESIFNDYTDHVGMM